MHHQWFAQTQDKKIEQKAAENQMNSENKNREVEFWPYLWLYASEFHPNSLVSWLESEHISSAV